MRQPRNFSGRSKPFYVIAALALAALLFGCVQQTTPATPTPPATVKVGIGADGAFSETNLTIEHGTTVEWTNSDEKPHDVWFIDDESPLLQKGDSWSRTFNEKSFYRFYCTVRCGGENTEGTITVK